MLTLSLPHWPWARPRGPTNDVWGAQHVLLLSRSFQRQHEAHPALLCPLLWEPESSQLEATLSLGPASDAKWQPTHGGQIQGHLWHEHCQALQFGGYFYSSYSAGASPWRARPQPHVLGPCRHTIFTAVLTWWNFTWTPWGCFKGCWNYMKKEFPYSVVRHSSSAIKDTSLKDFFLRKSWSHEHWPILLSYRIHPISKLSSLFSNQVCSHWMWSNGAFISQSHAPTPESVGIAVSHRGVHTSTWKVLEKSPECPVGCRSGSLLDRGETTGLLCLLPGSLGF